MVPKEDLTQQLKAGKKFTIKFGADPTSSDLHLGHLVVLKKLRQFQNAGHRVTFIIGDFTACIGDPTGRSETRPALDLETVRRHAQTYQAQVFRILDRSKTEVVFNSEWLSRLTPADLLQLMAKTTIAQLLEREDFKNRFTSKHPIGLHEFLYPLMQGYDSVHLKSEVEIGGSDQTFNLLMGRHLQKSLGLAQQAIITLPLLEGLDGVHKMSKSLGNHIAFNDSAIDQYGKVMSIPDAMMERYLTLLTDYRSDEIAGFMTAVKSGDLHPKALKQRIARDITGIFYAPESVTAAEQHFETVFGHHALPDTMPELKLSGPQAVLDVLTQHMGVPSRAEAKRLIQSGAVSVDQQKISDVQHQISSSVVIKAGKRNFLRLRLTE